MAKILIAEDEPNIREIIKLGLQSHNHTVIEASDGDEALALFHDENPEIILLDVMMPVRTGYETCLHIRRVNASIPIIMLSAKGQSSDRITGLGLGADDYIQKPFDMQELLARIANWVKRIHANQSFLDEFSFAGGRVEPRALKFCRSDGTDIPISPREIEIMRYLNRKKGVIVTRQEIYHSVWGRNPLGNQRTVDQYISSIRKKIVDEENLIKTISGWGYRYH